MRSDGPTTHMPLLCFFSVLWLCFSSVARRRGCRGKSGSKQRACRLYSWRVPEDRMKVSMPRNACLCTANQLQTEGVQKRQLLGWNEPPAFHQPQKSTSLICFNQKFPCRLENTPIITTCSERLLLESKDQTNQYFSDRINKYLLALQYASQQWNLFEQRRNRHFFKVNSRCSSEHVFTSGLSAHWHVFALCSGTTSVLLCKNSLKPERVGPAWCVCVYNRLKPTTVPCHGRCVAKTDGALDCSKSKWSRSTTFCVCSCRNLPSWGFWMCFANRNKQLFSLYHSSSCLSRDLSFPYCYWPFSDSNLLL